jgi:predicted flap endonuclease-1-like 5' DNA nuclease
VGYLIVQILAFLLIAIVLGFILGFAWRSISCNRRIAEMDAEATRLRRDIREMQIRAVAAEQNAARIQAENQLEGPDDLTRIRGIATVIERRLHDLGITTFAQIANFTDADIKRINQDLNFKGRVERDRWVEQAQDIVSQKSNPP